jgi:glycosyltransferase involved in cell wall biosynthesis
MDISIVIPTYNRKSKLKACLDSLFAQTCAQDSFEIIVVDDGSTDGTEAMLSRLSGENRNLRYFIQGRKGPRQQEFRHKTCPCQINWVYRQRLRFRRQLGEIYGCRT